MVEGNRFPGTRNHYRIRINRKRRNGIRIARRGYFRICDLVVLLSRYLSEGDSNLRLRPIYAAFRRAPHAKLGYVARSARLVSDGAANHDRNLPALLARIAIAFGRFADLMDIELRGEISKFPFAHGPPCSLPLPRYSVGDKATSVLRRPR